MSESPEEGTGGGLKRTLGVADLVFLNIAAILGIRWLSTAAQMGPASLVLWLLAVLIFFIPLGLRSRSASASCRGARRNSSLRR